MLTKEIKSIYDSLRETTDKKLPVKLSFVLSRNMKKMKDIMDGVDNEEAKLIRKYGEHDESGEVVIREGGNVKIEDVDGFTNEMSSVLDTEIDITFDTITEADVEKSEAEGYDHLTVKEIGALQSMIKTHEGEDQ